MTTEKYKRNESKNNLTEIINDSLISKFCKDKHCSNAYYRIVHVDIGTTGHLYIEAEQYNSFGVFKKMIRMPPILDNFIYIKEEDLPWIKSQQRELPFIYHETN